MSVRIDCTAPKHMPTLLTMLCSSRLLSHLTRVCTTVTFSSAVAPLVRPDRPSSSSSFKLCCPFFHCAIRRRLLSKGFHEVFMNFLGRHSFLREVLDKCSDFKFLHFANVSHPPLFISALHKQPSMTACFSQPQCPSNSSNDRLTKILFQ